MKDKDKRKNMVFLLLLLSLITLTIGVTYASFTFFKEGLVENVLETGTVMLTYTEGKTGITLNEAYPMSDENGMLLTGVNNVFDFTVQAILSQDMTIQYEVSAIKIPIVAEEALQDNEVKLYLEKMSDPETSYSKIMNPKNFTPRVTQSEIGSPIGSMTLDQGSFTTKGTSLHHYRLRMWIDENTILSEGIVKRYGVKINVYAKQTI